MSTAPAAAAASRWGGLTVAGMSLALPLAALREVVPLAPLAPLPCANPAVCGGLALRGVTVPVLDLAVLLGRPSVLAASNCVVTVVHGGRLLGLLAQGVNGVFGAEGSGLDAPVSLPPSTAFAGSLRRGDTGELANVLALSALAAMADLPWIDDPEPQRQSVDAVTTPDTATRPIAAAPRQALMLVRCDRLWLAIDALAVHAMLWEPRIDRSVLARGACRGTIEVDGQAVAALDLLALCGLGELPPGGRRQALVTRGAEGGLAALLVEEVIDIANLSADAWVPLTGAALPHPQLVRGVIDGQALRGGPGRNDFLVLDAPALAQLDELRNLARTNTPVAGTGSGASAKKAATHDDGSGSVITFHLPVEKAVPMEQVIEILAYGERDAMFGAGHPLRRIQVRRGRSLPVYCLARLTGGTVDRITDAAAVLVVDSGDGLVGFGVPQLRSIERAHWRHELPIAGGGRPEMVTVGEPAAQRTLELLDLAALAGRLHGGPLQPGA